jgi:hypothetical protein
MTISDRYSPDGYIGGRSFSLFLDGSGADFPHNEIIQNFYVNAIPARPFDPLAITGDARIRITVDENVAWASSPTEQGDAFLVHDANATHDSRVTTITWSLDGIDKDKFGINDEGQIWLRENPNHEGKSSYNVTIIASAGD